VSDRPVIQIVRGVPALDGAGVRLSRIIGGPGLSQLDPFLLLDEIRAGDAAEASAGFPDHPHRGFETVTYMLAGRMRHEDSRGNAGIISAGGVQWMTAGRGIVHSEMPETDSGALWGFQLWVNLPAALKMTAARYQEFDAASIPKEQGPGTTARVIAGQTDAGTLGPVLGISTEPRYLDVEFADDAEFLQHTHTEDAALVYVYRGSLNALGASGAAPVRVETGCAAILGAGERVRLRGGEEGAGALFLSARPLREPIARYGPFVMNTRAELQQAVLDFQTGRLSS